MPHDVPPSPRVPGLLDGGGQPAGSHPGGGIHVVTQLPTSVTDSLRHPGLLENPSVAVTVLAFAALLVAGWIGSAVRCRRLGRRPPHPVVRRLGLSIAVVSTLLAGTLLAVNSYVGYVPTFNALGDVLSGRAGASTTTPEIGRGKPGSITALGRPPASTVIEGRQKDGGRLIELQVGAPNLGVPPQRTFVLLPPGYDDPANAAVRYPVLYLIHGYPGTSRDWLVAGKAPAAMQLLWQHHLVGPMILVLPSVNIGFLHDSECLDAVHGAKVQTYLTTTVVNAIDSSFRTIADRTGRGIGGVSSGAYCALNVGLRHLNLYSAIVASLPYGDPGQDALHKQLGGSIRLFRQNSPSWYLPRMEFTQPIAVFLGASTNDETVRTATQLAKVLAARGQYVGLRLASGLGHTWREARAELPYTLVFADQHLAHAS